MAAESAARRDTPRLTWLSGVLMVAAALAVFAVAYAVGGLFGRQADDKVGGADARVVAPQAPAGTPQAALSAWEVSFDTRAITVPANQPVRLRLENRDAGIFHNIAVYRDAQASELVTRGTLFIGPDTRDYVLAALPPGTYYFQCDLHPSMNGTLVSQ